MRSCISSDATRNDFPGSNVHGDQTRFCLHRISKSNGDVENLRPYLFHTWPRVFLSCGPRKHWRHSRQRYRISIWLRSRGISNADVRRRVKKHRLDCQSGRWNIGERSAVKAPGFDCLVPYSFGYNGFAFLRNGEVMYAVNGYYKMPVSVDDYPSLFTTYAVKMNSPTDIFTVHKYLCDTSWTGFNFGNRAARSTARPFSYVGTNSSWMLVGDASPW